jgi:hypothetical protein
MRALSLWLGTGILLTANRGGGSGTDLLLRKARRLHRRDVHLLFLAAASASACGNAMSVSGARDGGVSDDSRFESPSELIDVLPSEDLPPQPDSGQAGEATPAGCANQVLDSHLNPVHGTVRGPRVEAEICDNGLGTKLLGPQDYLATPYYQDFQTTTRTNGAVPYGANGPGVYGFLVHAPADAIAADLSGSAGASAAAVGSYDSATNCGQLDFVVTLPIPPGLACTSLYPPCDPGCEAGGGELVTCVPAPVRMRYRARSAATCGPIQYPPAGDWLLTITSVSPLAVPYGYLRFATHGHLTATLVNQDDASDSVALDLDF